MTDLAKALEAIDNDDINKITESNTPNIIKPDKSEDVRIIIDVQVSTARAYPRSYVDSFKKIIDLSTEDNETAQNCFYSIKKDGKFVRGASIRLAEIIAAAYGNIRSAAKIISNDGKVVTVQGTCWDLESNVAYSIDVVRKITDKSGNTLNEDMQVIISNAACSIALRNSIFKVIPMGITKRIQDRIKEKVLGKPEDFDTTKKYIIEQFLKQDVQEKDILSLFDKKTSEELTRDDIFDLFGIATAIKEGDTTIQSTFSIAKSNNAIGKATKQLGDLPTVPTEDNITTRNVGEIANVIPIDNNSEQQDLPTDLGKAIENRKKNLK